MIEHWPEHQRGIVDLITQQSVVIDDVATLCRNRSLAVQAGGHYGIWPVRLSGFFDKVLSFEADAENYEYLQRNVAENRKIEIAPYALASSMGSVFMCHNYENTGMSHVAASSGNRKAITIDSLEIAPDLICFDIEGFELNALHGAKETIKQHRPVIVIEINGNETRYGVSKQDILDFFAECNYKFMFQKYDDFVFAPAEHHPS